MRNTEGEPDTLSRLDDFHAHGKRAPTSIELDSAVADAIKRAADAGASTAFVEELTHLLTRKYPDLWRLQLGADAPAQVTPMKIKFDEDKFPRNVHPRRYSPPQQKFLDTAIPEMVRVGILRRSTTRFVAPPFLPTKNGEGPDAYRFCVDSRTQNKCTESHSYSIPIINELLSRDRSGNGSVPWEFGIGLPRNETQPNPKFGTGSCMRPNTRPSWQDTQANPVPWTGTGVVDLTHPVPASPRLQPAQKPRLPLRARREHIALYI